MIEEEIREHLPKFEDGKSYTRQEFDEIANTYAEKLKTQDTTELVLPAYIVIGIIYLKILVQCKYAVL